MTDLRSYAADLKVMALIVSITLGLAGMAWTVVSWAASVKTQKEAIADHIEIQKDIRTVDSKAEAALRIGEQTQQTMGRDVKIIKCVITAPNKKAKGNCALE